MSDDYISVDCRSDNSDFDDRSGKSVRSGSTHHGRTQCLQEQVSWPKAVSDEQWQAVADNDASYDGSFFYAVRTTGIFCRPSCKSRLPKRENVGFFQTTDQALAAHYRPCKRCKPTGERLPDEEWIAVVTEYIDDHYQEPLKLESLAQLSHGSPYHLHRTFKRVKGITPMEYVQRLRIDKARKLLEKSTMAIAELGRSVGLANTPYFITLFKKKTGWTPEEYRRQYSKHVKEGIPE